jgi:hypothetical protein
MNNELANIGQHRRHKTVSKEMVRPPGTNKQKQPTEAGFPVPTSETVEYGKIKTKIERQIPH